VQKFEKHSYYCLNSPKAFGWLLKWPNLKYDDPENVMQAENIARLIIAQLKFK
jgi:hypothetical protein